jgi:hypothetical protein
VTQGKKEVSERIPYHLLPGIDSTIGSGDISNALYRDTLQHLGTGIGLHQWRQITVTFCQANKDPGAAHVVGDELYNIIHGHTGIISDQHYRMSSEKPSGAAWDLSFACEWLSAWWMTRLEGLIVDMHSPQTRFVL